MTTAADNELMIEARLFGKYLMGEEINDRAVNLYIEAHRNGEFESDAKDARILRFVLKHPAWLGCIDGGLAVVRNKSCLRKKLFYLLAILETVPEYAGHFLYQRSSMLDTPRIIFFGVRGILRMGAGCILCILL